MTNNNKDIELPEEIMPVCSVENMLKGQKALVTGANSGIGKGIAIVLGEAGADVVVNFVSEEDEAQKVVDEIKEFGSNAFKYHADVSKESEVKAMFQQMFKEFGTIDILVTNAGIQRDASIEEVTN